MRSIPPAVRVALVLSREGRMLVFSTGAELELLATNQFEDDSRFNSSSAIVGNELFVRSDKALYCVKNGD